jgi:AmmeMemoRadiSam system protein B
VTPTRRSTADARDATAARAASHGRDVVRPPAVAGAFYPAGADRLRRLVEGQLREAKQRFSGPVVLPGPAEPLGILVPHAGLEYSGVVAAAAWLTLAAERRPVGQQPPTIVLLGTNHRAVWLDGVGAWDRGAWATPLGDVPIDVELAEAVVALGSPFGVDLEAHLEEHSLEVQLPFLQVLGPASRIVPLAVSAGVGTEAVDAGHRLGELLAARRATGERIVLAISSDMAHYPAARDAELVTRTLGEALGRVDPLGLARDERRARTMAIPGLACGMCGIEPAVTGLAALEAMGAARGSVLAAGTSADAGGPPARTVGYLATRFD